MIPQNSNLPSPLLRYVIKVYYNIIFISFSAISIKQLESWEPNKELNTYLKSKTSPQVIHHDITLDNGSVSKVIMQLPVDADLSGATKYPMLIEVYGGPNSYMVTDSWTIDWGSYMASNKSIIYAKIDGRGSGLRGDKVLFSIYEKLGTVEIEDQINTAKKLHETLKYVDPNRIAIWGWSYGGYASGMSLAKDKEHVFKCAACKYTGSFYKHSNFYIIFLSIYKNSKFSLIFFSRGASY